MEAFFGRVRNALFGPPAHSVEHTFTYNVYNGKHVTGIVFTGKPNPEAGMAFEQFQVTLPRGEELSEDSVLLTISDVDPDDATKKGMMLILKAEPGCQQRKVLFQEWRESPNVGAVPFLQLVLKGGKAVKQSIRTADGSVAKQLSPEDIYVDGGYYFTHLAFSVTLPVMSGGTKMKLVVKRYHWQRDNEAHVTLERQVDGRCQRSRQESPFAVYRFTGQDWWDMEHKAKDKVGAQFSDLSVAMNSKRGMANEYVDIIVEVVKDDICCLYYYYKCKEMATFNLLFLKHFDGKGRKIIGARTIGQVKRANEISVQLHAGDRNFYAITSGDELTAAQRREMEDECKLANATLPKRYDRRSWLPLA